MPQCKLVGSSAFILWGSRRGLLPKFPAWEKEPFQETPPAQDPKTPSLQNMAGFIPSTLLCASAWQGLSPGHGVWLQLEDQSVQMEQLRQELDARRDELEQAQRSLSHAKQVQGWGSSTSPGPPQTLSQGDGPATTAEAEVQQQREELSQG